MTRTDKASTHTFHGDDGEWQELVALCPLKLHKKASKRVGELVHEEVLRLKGIQPEPVDKTAEEITRLQTALADLGAEADKTRKALVRNYGNEYKLLSRLFYTDEKYKIFERDSNIIINGARKKLGKFIQDNPFPDMPNEVQQLMIRLVELRIVMQESADKLRSLQRTIYVEDNPDAGSVERERKQQPHPKHCLECGHFPDNIPSALYYEKERDRLLSRLGPEKFAELTPKNVGLGVTVRCGAGFATNANGRTCACSRAIPKAAGEAISPVPPEMLEK